MSAEILTIAYSTLSKDQKYRDNRQLAYFAAMWIEHVYYDLIETGRYINSSSFQRACRKVVEEHPDLWPSEVPQRIMQDKEYDFFSGVIR